MKTTEIIQIVVIGSALVGGAAVIASKVMGPGENNATVAVTVPELTTTAVKGEKYYDKSCISCHGDNASGTKNGPPLVHDIYNPGHHADEAFYRATLQGVKQHHWPYGNMPPRPEISKREVSYIIAYVRELQEANGIVYKSHRM